MRLYVKKKNNNIKSKDLSVLSCTDGWRFAKTRGEDSPSVHSGQSQTAADKDSVRNDETAEWLDTGGPGSASFISISFFIHSYLTSNSCVTCERRTHTLTLGSCESNIRLSWGKSSSVQFKGAKLWPETRVGTRQNNTKPAASSVDVSLPEPLRSDFQRHSAVETLDVKKKSITTL